MCLCWRFTENTGGKGRNGHSYAIAQLRSYTTWSSLSSYLYFSASKAYKVTHLLALPTRSLGKYDFARVPSSGDLPSLSFFFSNNSQASFNSGSLPTSKRDKA